MGLRIGDLKDCVDHIFEIDSFKSKMGEDRDIVTLSFSVNEANAADDLMNFIEKGYEFDIPAHAKPHPEPTREGIRGHQTPSHG